MGSASKDLQMRRRYMKVASPVIVTTAVFAFFGRVDAQSFSSLYTSTAAKDCRVKNTGQDGSVSVCPGKAGLIVLVTEDDLRQTVSVGRNQKAAESEPAASSGFGIRANPNPNEVARKAADEIARDFKCGKDEVRIVGSRGRAIELAKP